MFQRDLVSRAIELALFSSRLEGEQPSSLLVAAQVEEGKSMRVSHYASMDSVAYLADATAYGIVKEYLEELQKGRIAHLIIPELIRLLAREDSGALIAFLGELMEEGIKEIQTYATSFRLPTPVKAGVIACIAKGNLSSRMRHWNETGFLSRFFVVSYSYSDETAERVMDSIIGRERQPATSLVLPEKQRVHLPENIARGLSPMAKELAQGLYAPLHGFRMQKHLQRLVMAAALQDGRDTVSKEDFLSVLEICKYANLDYKEL